MDVRLLIIIALLMWWFCTPVKENFVASKGLSSLTLADREAILAGMVMDNITRMRGKNNINGSLVVHETHKIPPIIQEKYIQNLMKTSPVTLYVKKNFGFDIFA